MLSFTIPIANFQGLRALWRSFGNTLLTVGLPNTPTFRQLALLIGNSTNPESAFNPAHPYYDEKSSRENPKWVVVHVEFRRKFKKIITLHELKSHATPGGPLENMQTLKQSRLSVTAVSPKEWEFIMKLAEPEDGSD